MKVLRTNLRQSLSGTGFILAALGTVLALVSANFEMLLLVFRAGGGPMEAGFLLLFLQEALSSETMALVLPIVAALPFTTSYFDDLHSGFIKAYLPRCGYRNYIAGKLTACALSGGLACVVGVIGFFALSALVFLPKISYLGSLTALSSEIGWILKSCMLLFFTGAFWSLIGMTAAALTNSKHMAYATPFIFFYVLVILRERYFKGIPFLNPKVWMDPATEIWGIALLLIMSVSVSLAFVYSAGRRLRNL